jgi:hypothetical protein
MKLLRNLGFVFMAAFCSSCTTDITKHPTAWTDFTVGGVYVLKSQVWISGDFLMTFSGHEPLDSEGRIDSGTRLVVRKVELSRGSEVGTFVSVLAEVLSGSFAGRTFNISIISKTKPSGFTQRDSDMLEPVDSVVK